MSFSQPLSDGQPSTRVLLGDAVRMAWPAVLESFFVALASMIDTLMVSALGSASVSAIGLTTQPKLMALTLFLSLNVGVSALVARRRGQNDQQDANRILSTALLFALAACLLISSFCVLLAGPIIQLCGSQPDTHADAALYFRIITGGLIFNVISLTINAAQRGSGNTRIAMTTNVTSSIVNMCGNYLLITGHFGFPALGIRGAALATVFGSAVACAMSIRSLFHPGGFVSLPYLVAQRLWPTLAALKSLFGLSINLMVENLFMRLGFIATAVMAAGLGTAPFAAHQVGMNLLAITFSFGDGMQAAAVALIGRSLGEKQPEKAKRYGRICQRIGLGISIFLVALLLLFGRPFYRLFFVEEEIIQTGLLILRFMVFVMLFQVSQVIYTGCLRGAGDVRYTLFASLISVTVVRTSVTFLLVQVLGWGISGIWMGIAGDQLMRLVLMGIRFGQGKWVELKI